MGFLLQAYVAVCITFSGSVLTPIPSGPCATSFAPAAARTRLVARLRQSGGPTARHRHSMVLGAPVAPFVVHAHDNARTARAGIYNLFFAFTSKSDKCFSLTSYVEDQTPFFQIIQQLIYFSVGMMTSTGFGDVYPRKWFTRLLASSQVFVRHSPAPNLLFC